jgi:hypothetical protein
MANQFCGITKQSWRPLWKGDMGHQTQALHPIVNQHNNLINSWGLAKTIEIGNTKPFGNQTNSTLSPMIHQ